METYRDEKIEKILHKVENELLNDYPIKDFRYKHDITDNEIEINFNCKEKHYGIFYKPWEIDYLGSECIYKYIVILLENKED